METIEKIMSSLGAADVDSRLEEQLIDGILYAFQEQTTEVRGAFWLYTHGPPCKHSGSIHMDLHINILALYTWTSM